MALQTKNPFARVIQMNDIRESELRVTMIEGDGSSRFLGELFGVSYNEQTTDRFVDIGGQSGQRGRKTVASGVEVVLTYQKGADGSFWRRRWLASKNGDNPFFTLKFETSDNQSPAIGKEVSTLNDCTIIGHGNAKQMSGSGTGTKHSTVTIWGMSEDLLEFFNEIQGAIQ